MPFLYKNENFCLSYGFDQNGATINLKTWGGICNTSQIPNIYPFILATIPSVLRNRCFNEDNLPFSEEIAKTEIGHFLEHVILEYMCILKARSSKSVSFSGKTFWEKNDNPTTNFTIKISCGLCDYPIFVKALRKGVETLNHLIKFGSSNLPIAAPSLNLPSEIVPEKLLPYLDQRGQNLPNNRSMSHR